MTIKDDPAPDLILEDGKWVRADGVGTGIVVPELGVNAFLCEDNAWRTSDGHRIINMGTEIITTDGKLLLLEDDGSIQGTTKKETKTMANITDTDGDVNIDQLWESVMERLDQAVESRAREFLIEYAVELMNLIAAEVREGIIDEVDSYTATMADSISELQEQVQILNENQELLNEAHDRVEELIYLASENPEEFIARARQGAVENASDRGKFRNADEVGDFESQRNRNSLKPGRGTNSGTQHVKEGVDNVAKYVQHAERAAGIMPSTTNVVDFYVAQAEANPDKAQQLQEQANFYTRK